jgi:sugar lactone lactonase YvrE
MGKQFIILAIAGVGTIFAFTKAQAGGLAFDPAGNLFVAHGHSVFKYAPDGTKSTFATGLNYPLGLCFDKKGDLFVSDGAVTGTKSQRSIFKFGPDGKKSIFASGISSVGMACDRAGNLFVSQGDSVFKFTPEGTKSTFVSGLGNPSDLAFDASGELFVADAGLTDARIGRSIVKITPDGTKRTFSTGLHDPSAMVVDASGTVCVTDEVMTATGIDHVILKLDPYGIGNTFTSAISGYRPWSLAVDKSGNLFFSNDHSIVKFDSSGTPSTFASDWISPDKRWEYKCVEYGAGECVPQIVKAGTTEIVLDLDQELKVNGPDTKDAEVVWGPDSKRFAFNYSPSHAHHTTYVTVAFYQLRDDKWVALHSPVDEASERAQLVELAKHYLPKSFNPRRCTPNRDVLKVSNWTDANTASLYAPCYGRTSGELEAGFAITLKFDDAGNWKIVKTHQMSKKELEDEQ